MALAAWQAFAWYTKKEHPTSLKRVVPNGRFDARGLQRVKRVEYVAVPRSADALINPELLVWARQSASMPIDEAADRLHISEEKLQAWEEGSQKPTVIQLRKAAKVYQQSFAAFYLPQPPAVFRPPTRDYRRLAGQAERAISAELTLDMRLTLDRREVYRELLAAQNVPPNAFSQKTTVRRAPESLSAELRKLLGITERVNLFETPACRN